MIQLTADGYTPLNFREEPATAGLDVFAAGFPASDAATIENVDYTLTSGIVSSLTADMGRMELWSDCGGIGTIAVVLAVTPFDRSYVIRMMFQAVDDRDLDAVDQALASFVANV